MLEKIPHSRRREYRDDGKTIKILYPGNALDMEDSGLGTIGRIDHVYLEPGTSIDKHPHENDEILSYLRQGTLIHKDSIGNNDELHPQRILVLNSGRHVEHEEHVKQDGQTVEMLQIFLRPEKDDLEPMAQFHDLDEKYSTNKWRTLAGNDQRAPVKFRSKTKCYDMLLKAGQHTSLPSLMQFDKLSLFLYVFSGSIALNDHYLSLNTGDSLYIEKEKPNFLAREDSHLILVVTDRNSEYSSSGLYSGKRW
ncbi:MAG: pirin family protein [Saprospiraceae bacterium]|nr:pirin family protein [Saprospiraceae bacterium]